MKKRFLRALIGGTAAVLLLLGFWVWFHLTGWSPQGRVPVDGFRLASSATVALFGSYSLAVAAEFACIFVLGAAIGISSMPFADDTHSLLTQSVVHFICTGGLVLLNAWVQGLFPSGGWAFFLVPYTLLYLLIWFGRWIGWYVEVARIRSRLGLAPAHSLLKWRETLPYLPFLLVLCVLLPCVLMGVDRLIGLFPVLSGLLTPYILYPVVGFCSGISLGKRQGLCLLYPTAAWLLNLPVVLILYNCSALFHCHTLFLFTLAGNLTGTAVRRYKCSRKCPS